MNDTERTERVEIDFTPTTTPSWVAQIQVPAAAVEPPPVPRGKRLARGTMSGRLARLPVVPQPDLVARLVPPPRRWGRVLRVDLSGAPIVRRAAPRRRAVSPLPVAAVLAAAIAALALVSGVSGPAASRAAVQSAAHAHAAVPGPAGPDVRVPDEPTITPILAPGEGLLAIAASTPCRILIDGHDTGLVTPQRELRIAAGRHRITLIDDAHRLEDHSEVVVGATPVTLTRDLSAFIR